MEGSEKWKVIIPPFPVGGGAVDTNDWCILKVVNNISVMLGLLPERGREKRMG